MTILPGNAPYDQLQDPSLPIYKDIYFLNLTNPEAFSNGEEAPDLDEIGPYSYRLNAYKIKCLKFEIKKKIIIIIQRQCVLSYICREYRLKFYNESDLIDDNTKLIYTQLKTFYFNPDTSGDGLEEDDVICTINLAMVVCYIE